MEKFSAITSKAVPLRIKDVDTDMIFPATFMTTISRSGHGDKLFYRLREASPDFPFNQPRYQGARILAADHNFGCGSSREHAVWALTDWGIRAVIAKSFADIFFSNAGKNGLLLVTLPDAVVDEILSRAEREEYRLTVDLESQTVRMPDGAKHAFSYDAFRKHCLLSGLDDVDYIRSHQGEIDAFRSSAAKNFFFSTLQPNR